MHRIKEQNWISDCYLGLIHEMVVCTDLILACVCTCFFYNVSRYSTNSVQRVMMTQTEIPIVMCREFFDMKQ